MSTATDESIRTRQSLLSRLRNLDDQDSWRDFFERYWRLLYNVARRAGLEDSDARDVVQETVIAVARRIPGFQYDARRGSFKGWLFCITQRRVADHLRKCYRRPRAAQMQVELLDSAEEEEIALEAVVPEQTWQEEWERAMFEAAVAQVRSSVNPKKFQIFDYCVLMGWPVKKVAATLGLNPAQVYLAKHRVAQAVKRVARELSASNGPEDV